MAEPADHRGCRPVCRFVWFEVLRNHSLVHVLFVYRSLGVSAGIVAVALLVGSGTRCGQVEPADTDAADADA